MTTRSKLLAHLEVTVNSVYTTLYTAPSDVVALVKDFRFYVSSGAGAVYCVHEVAGTPITFAKILTPTTDATYFIDEPWVVLEPGDKLRVYQTKTGGGNSTVDYVVSGAELPA